ncbi:WbqC family protein [Halomonas organivorans]
MRVAIMQPYFFPYIGYWQLVHAVDEFVIFDDVNFISRGYINRNSILINGEPSRITLNLCKASRNKKINEISVGDNRDKLLRTIELAYRKAPFFDKGFPLIEKSLRQDEDNLAHFLGNTLRRISNYLGYETRFSYSSHIEKDTELRGQAKILAICEALGAHEYINPIGGVELYSREAFKNRGINLYFLETKPEVKRLRGKHPPLSIIDAVMHLSPDNLRELSHEYTLT